MKKVVGVVTTSRADFGLLYPVIRKIQLSSKLEVKVIVTGLHLLKQYGDSLKLVKEKIGDCDIVDLFLDANDKYSTVKSMGIGFMSFSEYLKNKKIDLIMVLGDRTELIVPVYSAMLCNIPIAHLFGGDSVDEYLTYDNNIRHCITKLSNLHFAATESHANRILKLGEESWRVFNVGSPAIDYMKKCEYVSIDSLNKKFSKIDFNKPFALLTFHPVHLELDYIHKQIQIILNVLKNSNIQVVCTKPNNDIGSDIIMNYIQKENLCNDNFFLVDKLTQEEYYSLIKYCSFMIGNSSSIVLESTSLKIPAINVGNRQKGRLHGNNVMDVDYSEEAINSAINKALYDNEFKKTCDNSINPYGDGKTAEKIVGILENMDLQSDRLLIKKITY